MGFTRLWYNAGEIFALGKVEFDMDGPSWNLVFTTLDHELS